MAMKTLQSNNPSKIISRNYPESNLHRRFVPLTSIAIPRISRDIPYLLHQSNPQPKFFPASTYNNHNSLQFADTPSYG
jgi:hypothetical protein